MTVRTLYQLAAAVSLGLAGISFAKPKQTPSTQEQELAPVSSTEEPGKLPAAATEESGDYDNQQMANELAVRLRKSGVAKGVRLTITAQEGVVELAGMVRS